MKIITINLNGIRAAARKGFYTWLLKQNADIVCMQELKAQAEQIESALFNPQGYYSYYFCAQKKGYSGVGLYTRIKPDNIVNGLGFALADTEGRHIQAEFGNLCVASVYFPSGSSGNERQQLKYQFMESYWQKLVQWRQQRKEFIICGDWNIVHKEIDIRNWKSNQKNSGCLPQERAWLDKIFNELGFVDAFRVVNNSPEQYTWWSNRGQSWQKNVGWRIDYQVITPGLKPFVKRDEIYKQERFSDHAPLILEYDMSLR